MQASGNDCEATVATNTTTDNKRDFIFKGCRKRGVKKWQRKDCCVEGEMIGRGFGFKWASFPRVLYYQSKYHIERGGRNPNEKAQAVMHPIAGYWSLATLCKVKIEIKLFVVCESPRIVAFWVQAISARSCASAKFDEFYKNIFRRQNWWRIIF